MVVFISHKYQGRKRKMCNEVHLLLADNKNIDKAGTFPSVQNSKNTLTENNPTSNPVSFHFDTFIGPNMF
jgi:hypothetical protein